MVSSDLYTSPTYETRADFCAFDFGSGCPLVFQNGFVCETMAHGENFVSRLDSRVSYPSIHL